MVYYRTIYMHTYIVSFVFMYACLVCVFILSYHPCMYAFIHCKLCIYAYLVFVTSISIDQLNTSMWNTKPAIDHLINQYAHIWADICICETSLHTYLTLLCETLNHRWCVIEQSICNRYPPHLPSHLINALFKHVVNNIETPPSCGRIYLKWSRLASSVVFQKKTSLLAIVWMMLHRWHYYSSFTLLSNRCSQTIL